MAEAAKYLNSEHPDHLGGKVLYILSLHNKDIVCVCSVTQSCPVCDAMDCNLSVFSVHGNSQARIVERVGISSHRGFSQPRDPTCVSCVFCIGRQIESVIQKQGRKRNYNFIDLRIQCY